MGASLQRSSLGADESRRKRGENMAEYPIEPRDGLVRRLLGSVRRAIVEHRAASLLVAVALAAFSV